MPPPGESGATMFIGRAGRSPAGFRFTLTAMQPLTPEAIVPDLVDAYGHVGARHPGCTDGFQLARRAARRRATAMSAGCSTTPPQQRRTACAAPASFPSCMSWVCAARETVGEDPWSDRVAAHVATRGAFARHHHGQGVSARAMAVDELFHPATCQTHNI